jgi:8-oxo-dGTP pyrophosphatase MutT (NUDIX family)
VNLRRQPQPVAAAIVTSSRGVLAGKRNDGKPPWTFIAGEVEPGETAPFAAVREVKEETGLEARAKHEIGRRVHPKTGRTMIYVAAEPVRQDDLDVFVGDTDELAEVRWLSLAEADELLPACLSLCATTWSAPSRGTNGRLRPLAQIPAETG